MRHEPTDHHRPGHPDRGPRARSRSSSTTPARSRDAQFHVTQFRGFEKLCEGRPVHEMPALMARICGICPVSHLSPRPRPCDAIMAVAAARRPPRTCAASSTWPRSSSRTRSSFFHLSSPDLLLGMDADPARRNIFGVMRPHPRDRARRHPPAPVRPAGHRAARRQADSPGLGRPGRRERAARRREARPHPRGDPRSAERSSSARCALVQGDARALPRRRSATSATSHRCSWGWSTRRRASSTTTASCASSTPTGDIVADGDRPARLPRLHRRDRRAVVAT